MLEKLLQSLPPVTIVDSNGPYAKVDLSVQNRDLPSAQSAQEFEGFIEDFLLASGAKVAYGGYCEQRSLYKRSDIFNDLTSEERDIHIGLDLWCKAETAVFAALDGHVHSFNYNAGLGNYGPTIILSHKIAEDLFYTLYGHLSVESITDIEIGDFFKSGEKIGTLGDASVNGDYAPHLHFQLIKDIQDNFGDYPGVCSKTDLPFYLKNCPDPNLLLKLK
jgi:murein DD-endopeptidase MepM/ murein hydrolase activator NlpD